MQPFRRELLQRFRMTCLMDDNEFEFTADMAENLLTYFAIFADDGVVKVVKDQRGLWLVSADRRAFLGLARLPECKGSRLN